MLLGVLSYRLVRLTVLLGAGDSVILASIIGRQSATQLLYSPNVLLGVLSYRLVRLTVLLGAGDSVILASIIARQSATRLLGVHAKAGVCPENSKDPLRHS